MQSQTITRTTNSEQIAEDDLAVFSINTMKTGKVRSVCEYIDLSTGELIPSGQLSIGVLDLREKYSAREDALASLRPEVRSFAFFVLRFANRRRGITPGVRALCQWFGHLHSKQTQHIRRYVPALVRAGILAGDALLGPLFQRTGGRAGDHLGEDFRAWCIFQKLCRDRELFDPAAFQGQPGDPALVAEEVERLEAELRADTQGWKAIQRAAKSSEIVVAQQSGPVTV
jgi:hypothetical protein